MMKHTIIFLLAVGSLPCIGQVESDSMRSIIGAWKSIPKANDKFEPKFEIIISKDSILISKHRIGSAGCKQLLTYNISNDTIYAVEDEIMFFDQNIGFISGHYKFRNKKITIKVTENRNGPIIVLYPIEPGGVLIKVSDDSTIACNFDDLFNKWRVGNEIKLDYKRNGRPRKSGAY